MIGPVLFSGAYSIVHDARARKCKKPRKARRVLFRATDENICFSQCTPCPLGSTSPAGSTGEDACHFSMAFTYELAREEYLVAANNLKHAVGPYKSARVCTRPFLLRVSSLCCHPAVPSSCVHGSRGKSRTVIR